MSLTLRQAITKRQALAAIAHLESVRKEPEELAALLDAEKTIEVRKYIKKFDRAADLAATKTLQYIASMEIGQR